MVNERICESETVLDLQDGCLDESVAQGGGDGSYVAFRGSCSANDDRLGF